MQARDKFKETLDQLYTIAEAAVAKIKQLQPDFVVILLHSGWVVYHAAHAIWQHTETTAFPAIFPINIGTEKGERYNEHRQSFSFSSTGSFLGGYTDPAETGYFLNWVARQSDWIDWVRNYAAGLGFRWDEVSAILILDDTHYEGKAFLLSQQLFESSFPNAQVHFLAGSTFDWHSRLAEPWLEQHQVELPDQPNRELSRALWRADTETADLARDSFGWQPLHAGLAELQPLAAYLPIATWLELPAWIRDQIIQYAANWCQSSRGEKYISIWNYGYCTSDHLFKHIWACGSITSKQLTQIASISLKEARKYLRRYYELGVLVQRETENGRVYQLSPEYSMTDWQADRDFETFWVLPGQVVSGDFIGWRSTERITETITALKGEGLDAVVELDQEDDMIIEKLEQLGLCYYTLPVATKHYDRDWIAQTLVSLNKLLDQHRTIYLTGTNSSTVGLILGCLLVQNGRTGPAALRYLKRARKNLKQNWAPFPDDFRARRIIKTWPR